MKTVTEGRDGKVTESLADGMPLIILYGHKNWVLSVNFSADGRQLCSGSADCSCIVWNIAERKVRSGTTQRHHAAAPQLRHRSCGTTQQHHAAAPHSGTAATRGAEAPLAPKPRPSCVQVQHRIKHTEWVECAAFSPAQGKGEQRGIAACGHDIDIRLWNVSHAIPELIALLPAQISYLMMFFFGLRSLVYGSTWKSPPLSHQRHAALRMLFDRLDPFEGDSVPVSDVIQQMAADPLLALLLEQPENGADLMRNMKPRSVLAALTQWSLSGDSHIQWKQLLPLFMDPTQAISTDPEDGELTGTLSMVTRALRRSVNFGRSSRGSASTASTLQTSRGAASRHRRALRSSLGASASSDDDDLARSSALRRAATASSGDEPSGLGSLGGVRAAAKHSVAFAGDPMAKVVELMRTPMEWGLKVDDELRVLEVKPGSQAARSLGFAVGDRLVSLNGQPLGGGASYKEQLGAIAVGTKVAIEISKAPSA